MVNDEIKAANPETGDSATPTTLPELKLSIRTFNGLTTELPAKLGRPLFIVGANGVGKSGLMQQLYINNKDHAIRIVAHRQNWMQSNYIPFSPQDKINTMPSIQQQDLLPNARWTEWNSQFRNGIIISDLIDADNSIARKARKELKDGNAEAATRFAKKQTPLELISDLLKGSGIPIELSVADDNAIVARKRMGSPYSIAALSDGERSAVITSAIVLTAKPGFLILIDEPERHLHGSIVTPLLTQLFAQRPDCTFIVSTHELSLPIDSRQSQSVIVRDCKVSGDIIDSWDIDILEAGSELDDSLKETILGARRRILFIEGKEHSLDMQLYARLFPGVTVSSRESCREVEKYVDGVQGSATLHWVKAFGIVDQDQITPEKRVELMAKGVFPLHCYSVEGIYYDSFIQARIANRQSALIGADPNSLILAAVEAFIRSITPHLDRLAARMTEQSVKDKFTTLLPTWRDILHEKVCSIDVNAVVMFAAEKVRLRNYMETKNIEEIIRRYPIRETPALDQIALALKLKDRQTYEAAVRKLVDDEPQTKQYVLAFFSPLSDQLEGA